MKKIFNKIKISLIVSLLLPVVSFAGEGVTTNVKFDNPLTKAPDIFSLIYGVLQFISQLGAILVVLMIIYSGFLFVSARGSEEKISTAKKTFTWSIIGAVVLLGATALAEVVCNIANGLGAGVSCVIG